MEIKTLISELHDSWTPLSINGNYCKAFPLRKCNKALIYPTPKFEEPELGVSFQVNSVKHFVISFSGSLIASEFHNKESEKDKIMFLIKKYVNEIKKKLSQYDDQSNININIIVETDGFIYDLDIDEEIDFGDKL